MYRNTHHKRAERRPQAPQCDDADHGMTRFAEVGLRKDAQVLQQDGKLRETERRVVDPDRRPEPHGDDLVFGTRELPDVLAHAELGLLVGRDAEHDGQHTGYEDQGIIRAGLLCDERASTEACNDRQACHDGEDDRHNVEGYLRRMARDSRHLNGCFFRVCRLCHGGG